MKKYKYKIKDSDCINCTNKLKNQIKNVSGLNLSLKKDDSKKFLEGMKYE